MPVLSCAMRGETQIARGANGGRFRSSVRCSCSLHLYVTSRNRPDSYSIDRPITCARALDLRRD